MSLTQVGYGYKNLTATANVRAIPCTIAGVLCASSTSGTIAIYDSATTTTSDPVVGAMNLVAGTYYPINATTEAGCYVVIGGTTNVTVMVV